MLAAGAFSREDISIARIFESQRSSLGFGKKRKHIKALSRTSDLHAHLQVHLDS